MSDGRQRLKPWLESKIESGKILDLHWIDRNQKIFQIPWKRNGTSEWAREHSAIFREWAIHTGKFHEGLDKEDYPTWKTRLRCALHKHPEIIQLKEQNDGNEPFRIYQILDNNTYDDPMTTQGNEVEMVEDYSPPVISSNNVAFTVMDQTNFNVPKETFQNSETFGSLGSDLKSIKSSDLIAMPSDEYKKLECQEGGMSDFGFELIFRFQTHELRRDSFKRCCFLTKDNTHVLRYQDFPEAFFPDIPPETEEVQDTISLLWQNLKEGIYIYLDDNYNILAQRFCKCRIYYSGQYNQNELKLNRSDGKTWTTIFNFQEFCGKLSEFCSKLSYLHSDVTLYIGQRGGPNPYNFSGVILSVTISHLYAKKLLSIENMKRHKISLSV